MKQILQLSQMPRLIMTVTLVVMIGGLFGAVVYLVNTSSENNLPVINPLIEGEVIITTDKMEYEQGEDVVWNSNNYKAGHLFLLQESCNKTFTTGPELEEYKNSVWKRNGWVDDLLFCRSDFRLCEDAELNCVRSKQDFNRIIKTKYNDFKKATNNNEVFLEAGLYRIKMTFGNSCNEQLNNKKKLGNVFTVYSNEFTIKEKLADFYFCERDSDCISIDKNCCGCNAGGSAVAINKKFKDDWNKKLDCREIMCPAVMSNDPSCFQEPKCENNKCILANFITL